MTWSFVYIIPPGCQHSPLVAGCRRVTLAAVAILGWAFLQPGPQGRHHPHGVLSVRHCSERHAQRVHPLPLQRQMCTTKTAGTPPQRGLLSWASRGRQELEPQWRGQGGCPGTKTQHPQAAEWPTNHNALGRPSLHQALESIARSQRFPQDWRPSKTTAWTLRQAEREAGPVNLLPSKPQPMPRAGGRGGRNPLPTPLQSAPRQPLSPPQPQPPPGLGPEKGLLGLSRRKSTTRAAGQGKRLKSLPEAQKVVLSAQKLPESTQSNIM